MVERRWRAPPSWQSSTDAEVELETAMATDMPEKGWVGETE